MNDTQRADKPSLAPETRIVIHGTANPADHGAASPPIYLSTTFAYAAPDVPRDFDYSRMANPTRDQLGAALADLEGGAGAVITASGMAAIDLLINGLEAGDLIVAPHDCYGGTGSLLRARAARGQIRVNFIDLDQPDAVAEALAHKPRLLLIETPSNPLMRIVDIAALADQARSVGAKVAVDNTFLTPALQNPLALGADYVIHSTTKFINGHSDVVGGAVVAGQPAEFERFRAWASLTGAIASPFDSWLTLRGVRTLFARMERQQANAHAIARFLNSHPAVAKVYYPGLECHPHYALAQRQQRGAGAMLSFELNTDAAGISRMLAALKLFTLAKSLGGVESLIAHPASMTHAEMGKELRANAGIHDNLLRLSVGMEAAVDLIADLERGLSLC
ncbi:MAG: cystathionine gamma-synthase [Sphingomonadales bacterium]|nr:cystathionine gamma-synthase [Sphingomonadales bacterium]MDE2171240.1 cystathionine gamma-synthase [Sphingomonadales bacterium]